MEYDFLTTEPTREQKVSSTKLTSLVSEEDLGKMAPIVKELEEEGFLLIDSNPSHAAYSILMPSRKILDVARNKRALDNCSEEPNSEISKACLYFGTYISLLSQIHN